MKRIAQFYEKHSQFFASMILAIPAAIILFIGFLAYVPGMVDAKPSECKPKGRWACETATPRPTLEITLTVVAEDTSTATSTATAESTALPNDTPTATATKILPPPDTFTPTPTETMTPTPTEVTSPLPTPTFESPIATPTLTSPIATPFIQILPGPREAQGTLVYWLKYLNFVEHFVGAPITIIGVSP